jgi:hypothetical protein
MPAVRFTFSALSSNSSGSRFFKPRDAGATPVEAATFLARSARFLIRDRSARRPIGFHRSQPAAEVRQGLISDAFVA